MQEDEIICRMKIQELASLGLEKTNQGPVRFIHNNEYKIKIVSHKKLNSNNSQNLIKGEY